MTITLTTPRGDRVAFDRYGDGPALVFIAGAGPYRAGDPITTETAERAASPRSSSTGSAAGRARRTGASTSIANSR